MRKPATVRRVLPAPTEEDPFIRLTIDALKGLITDLRFRVEQTGTRREAVQVLLAEAHIDEATGLLRAIQPTASVRECHEVRPKRHPSGRVQQTGRPRLRVVFRPVKQ